MTERTPEEKRELLARLLRDRAARAPADAAPDRHAGTIPRVPRGGDLPTSLMQQQTWVGDQIAPESNWNVLALFRLDGPLDQETVRRSIETIVGRHESLRTVFVARNGMPAQRILPPDRCDLPVVDLRDVPESQRETRARQLAIEFVRAPIDLAAGPLFRAQLLRLGAEQHLLLLVFHHIISDGWSVDLFFHELATCYAAFRSGKTPDLPVLLVQAADVAQWQRDRLSGDVLGAQRAYWEHILGGELPAFGLATDHPNRESRTFEGAAHHSVVGRDVLEGLRDLSRREGVTLFTTLLTAFETLLIRYTGLDDVRVGTVVVGRERAEMQHLIGVFVNAIVLRTDLSGDPTFREALARSHRVVLGAHAHSEYPYEKLVADLQPDRDRTRTPLAQITINKISLSSDLEREAAGIRFRLLPSYEVYSLVDTLNLFLSERKEALDLWFIRAIELFEPETIARMERHFHTLLAAIVANPDRPLSVLPLEPASAVSIAHGIAGAEETFPDAAPFPRLFEACVRRSPTAIAVADENGPLTYAALDGRADRIARRLRALGVAPRSHVGVCIRRSADLVAAIIGIHKAGSAYVPIDPAYPPARRAFMLADSGASALIVSGEAGAAAAPSPVHVLDIGRGAGLDAQPDTEGDVVVAPGDTAYVMYTSGSTGQPKGVVIRHDGLTNYLLWAVRAYDIASGCGAPVHSSIAFDLTVTSLLAVLVAGRTAFLVPEGDGVEGLAAALRADRDYSLVKLTPSHLDLLREQFRAEPFTSRVRVFVIGGEQLLGEQLTFWQDAMPDARFVNEYGPTETVVGCCVEILGARDRVSGPVPIGTPIANMRMHVMGGDTRPVAEGLVGELYIGGVGVGAGYLHRPDLTRYAFLPDSFATDPAAHLYRTGDRGRLRRDGRLEYLGRVDTQVKIRGYRIEPGEVEAAIAATPGVTAAAVIVDTAPSGEKVLAAFFVAGGDPAPAPGDVRAALRTRLPEHMVPWACTRVDALPVTGNGKIDRRALKTLRARAAAAFVGPRTPVEEFIAGIWARGLGVERVSMHDNFFELGGYSLLAVRVVTHLRDAFGVDVRVRDLFERPTVARLAAHLGALRRVGGPASKPMRPADRTQPLVLSSGQQRLWFFDQLEPGSAAYNIPAVVQMRGTLDTAALEASLTEVSRRHEVLRTTFSSRDGQPRQDIHAASAWIVPMTDVGHLHPDAREDAALQLAAAEAARPFDLANGPLVRAQLIRIDHDRHFFLVTFHHAVADGWSLAVFLRDFAASYAAYATGGVPALPSIALQYADYAAWEQAWLSSDAQTTELAYWRDRLADAPAAIDLPVDDARPAAQTFTGGVSTRTISSALRDRLEALGNAENATLFMTLLAAFGAVLGRVSGQNDVCIGVPVAGRGRLETESLIGVFINVVVMRVRLDRGAPFRDQVARVRETALSAYAHEDLPFDRVVEALSPERDLRRTPLFQVMFNMNTYRGPMAFDLPGLHIEAPPIPEFEVASKFEMTLYVTDEKDGVQLALVYNANLFSETRIDAMLDEFVQTLESIAADPETDLMSVSLVTRAAARAIPDPTAPLDKRWTEPVHIRFSRHAEVRPAHLAVVDPERAWSYGELDRESNRLANHLIAHGIGREDPVAIYAQRNGELAWALLGVLKAGAAFVIIDPAYPAARTIESLRAVPPRAWVTLSGTPALPDELARFLSGIPRLAWISTAAPGDPASAWADASAEAPEVRVGADDLAYVVFTSGSTGTPKAIAGTHAPLSHFFEWHASTSGLGPEDRFSVLSGLAHDPLLRDILGAFWAGATVCLPDARDFGTPGYLRRWLAAEGVTVAHMTPATSALILEARHPMEGPVGTLRYVFFGADTLSADTVRAVRTLTPHATLANFYGASETPQAVAWHPIADDEALPPTISLGRGIEDVQLLVLNPAGGMAGVGELGEICVRTPYLARGYVGDASLTAQRFVANPFGQDPADRIYRTGDLGRYRADGRVEFAGRRDQQVKVRGFRVELGEIEAALRAIPGVGEAAVIVDAAADGDARLIAYVGGAPGDLDAPAVRARLRTRLPEYMVPARVVILVRLPRTPNGKLDRAALPRPESVGMEARVAARTDMERQIAAAWTELLGHDQFGVHDSFFEVGGHSLLATRLIARIERVFGTRLAIRTVFEASTIEQLAQVIEIADTAVALAASGSATGEREEIEF